MYTVLCLRILAYVMVTLSAFFTQKNSSFVLSVLNSGFFSRRLFSIANDQHKTYVLSEFIEFVLGDASSLL